MTTEDQKKIQTHLDSIISLSQELRPLLNEYKVLYDKINSLRYSIGIETTHFDKAIFHCIKITNDPK